MIADQIISRIASVHQNNFIHRDIKPENFTIGSGKTQMTVYIIDYGLAKRYIDPKTSEHINMRTGRNLTGTARYASLSAH